MEFRKMVRITLYARQQKRHRCIEQSFGLWERPRAGWYGRMALKHVYYHMWNELPVQVQCMIQGAQGWCTGMTQRDGRRREVEVGSGWGTHVHPWWIHLNVWQNQYNIIKFKNTDTSPKEWDGERGRSRVQDGEHMYTHGGFMSMYGKNQYNIVK